MATKSLEPMAPGGVWLHLAQKGPEYVTHEAHIKRLMSEGGRIVDDPRVPVEVAEPPIPAPTANETAMQAKIEQLEMLVKQLLEANQPKASDASNEDASDAKPKRK